MSSGLAGLGVPLQPHHTFRHNVSATATGFFLYLACLPSMMHRAEGTATALMIPARPPQLVVGLPSVMAPPRQPRRRADALKIVVRRGPPRRASPSRRSGQENDVTLSEKILARVSSVQKDAEKERRGRTILEFSQVNESTGNVKQLTGLSVLEAFQRAALRDKAKPKKRKSKSSTVTKTASDSEYERSSGDPLPPLVFKSEWASRIQELEDDLKSLRRLI